MTAIPDPPLSAASRPKRRAETPPEASIHGQDIKKRDRVNHDLDREIRSPSPWPSLPPQAEQYINPLDTAQQAYVRRQVRKAIQQSLDMVRTQQDTSDSVKATIACQALHALTTEAY